MLPPALRISEYRSESSDGDPIAGSHSNAAVNNTPDTTTGAASLTSARPSRDIPCHPSRIPFHHG
jgi:hypothetical protein